MLHEEVKKYRELSGDTNPNTPISRIGGYLDGYEKALEQEPKTGHWIRWYEQKDFGWYIENIPYCKCSECGKEYDSHSSQFIKYCNECGARMVGDAE